MGTDLATLVARGDGFTLDPGAGRLVRFGDRSGYAVAVPGTGRVVTGGREDIAEAVADVITAWPDRIARGAMVGGWLSDDRSVYVVELADVLAVDRPTAVLIGRMRGQEAIADMATGELIAVADASPTAPAPVDPALASGTARLRQHIGPEAAVAAVLAAARQRTAHLRQRHDGDQRAAAMLAAVEAGAA